VNDVLEQIYRTKRVEDAEGNRLDPFPTAIPRETAAVLGQVILERELARTLEVGMAYGLSALAICEVHDKQGSGEHIAVDPNQSRLYRNVGLLNVERARLEDHLRFIEAPSHEALPRLLEEGVELDFAFIDGAHLFDFALLDFFYIDRLLRVGGIVAFDDLWMPAIRRVISFVLTNRKYRKRSSRSDWSVPRYLAALSRRVVQHPLERDHGGVRLIRGNVCLLEKLADDDRPWAFHKAF
jgi:predicted O-methyltransferase YrrM